MLDMVTGSSPRRIRQKNVAAALRCLHSFGAMSRADLARKLGLNRSSSGQIVAELTESGLVREVDVDSVPSSSKLTRAGRPGIKLELIPDAAFFIGVEIGVEHISALVLDLCGKERLHKKLAFDTPSVLVQDALKQGIDLALEGAAPEMVDRCQGLGISAPAHITSDGFVTLGPIIGWKDVDLAQLSRNLFPRDVPIKVENDANAFALGDAYKHGQSGTTLFLVMETGVGGGLLIDGKLFRGGHGLAGEIGHTLVPGSNGQSLEQLVGRDRLISRFREAEKDQRLDLQDFLAAVRERVPSAVSIADEWAKHLAYALLQACRLIDPNRIVLGGSVAPLFSLVEARVKAHMSTGQRVEFPAPDIIVDQDAEFGSAFGAACLMHRQFMSESNSLQGQDNANQQEEAEE